MMLMTPLSLGIVPSHLNELTASDLSCHQMIVLQIDANDSSVSRKEAVAVTLNAIAGDGLSATNGVLAVGVDDSSIETNRCIKNQSIRCDKQAC